MMRLLLLAALMLVGLAAPANAALTLCNRTSYILYAATAAADQKQTQVQGWVRIAPGVCLVARPEALTAQHYLVHARSGIAHSGSSHDWGGHGDNKTPLCVRDGNFTLHQPPGQCPADGSFALPFAPIATQGRRDWTMSFDEQPAYASLDAAQLAGVKRLLADNGFNAGAINGTPDKKTGTALAAFRKLARLGARDGNDTLFAALENRALTRVAPAGYTVCNHGQETLLLALGESIKGNAVSRGWWTVQSGGCAKLLTEPLATDAIFLLAQTQSGKAIVRGQQKFCTAATAFEINGTANCAAHGYAEAGFARTDTKNRTGYTAHIGTSGLTASRP